MLADQSFIKVLILTIPFIMTGLWIMKVQRKYLELYRKKKKPNFPVLQEEIQAYFFKHPLQWYFNTPSVVFKICKDIWKRDEDKELEEAARKLRKSWLILIIALISSLFLISVL